METFISTFLKIFFMMTPFLVLTVFLTITQDATVKQKRALAIKVTVSVIITCVVLLFFGKYIFNILGITLDAFRMGAGALLFLTAIDLVKGVEHHSVIEDREISQLAVVPLAIPMTIGPGTTGILLLMGASFNDISNFITESLALLSAVLVIGLMLFSSTLIEAIVGKEGLQVISKITGLFLAALSAQIMFTGVKNFLGI